MGELLTIQEVAERLNLSRSRVYALIRDGRLPSARKPKGSRDWWVDSDDLERPDVKERPTGYPKGRPRSANGERKTE